MDRAHFRREATQQLTAPLDSEFVMNNALQKFIDECEVLTGCHYNDIPRETLTDLRFNYPGKVLCFCPDLNLTLCEADQVYTEGKATGVGLDYCLVDNNLDRAEGWVAKWFDRDEEVEVVVVEDEDDPMMLGGNTSII